MITGNEHLYLLDEVPAEFAMAHTFDEALARSVACPDDVKQALAVTDAVSLYSALLWRIGDRAYPLDMKLAGEPRILPLLESGAHDFPVKLRAAIIIACNTGCAVVTPRAISQRPSGVVRDLPLAAPHKSALEWMEPSAWDGLG